MSIEENKAVIRRWLEMWSTGDLGAMEEVIAPDYVRHFMGRALRPESGPKWYRGHVSYVRTAYPDLRIKAEDLLADGDRVIGRWSVSGTHQGDELTPWGTTIRPTGNKVTWTAIFIFRLASGRIAEEWWEVDYLGALMQIGAIPGGSADPGTTDNVGQGKSTRETVAFTARCSICGSYAQKGENWRGGLCSEVRH